MYGLHEEGKVDCTISISDNMQANHLTETESSRQFISSRRQASCKCCCVLNSQSSLKCTVLYK
jgi:hypothetical protein